MSTEILMKFKIMKKAPRILGAFLGGSDIMPFPGSSDLFKSEDDQC